MISINNVTLSGKVCDIPRRIDLEDCETAFVVFRIKNETMISGQRKNSYSIDIRCNGNVAEFVDANITADDKVVVSGTIGSSNKPCKGVYVNTPHIRALSVSKLEQEMYK